MTFQQQRQIQLLFTPANGQSPPFAQKWRDVVAGRLKNQQVPAEQLQRLFHHTADGKTAMGKPSVCFIGSRAWLGVAATGAPAIEAVNARVMDLVQAAQDLVGPCRVEHHELQLALSFSERPYSYAVRSFVGTERDRDWKPAKIRDRLIKSLNDWAQAHGVVEAGEAPFKPEDVMLESVTPAPPAINVAADGSRTVRSRASVVFYMPWKLHGIWMAGSQTSKGHGLVRFILSAATRGEGGANG